MASKEPKSKVFYEKVWQWCLKHPGKSVGIILLVTTIALDFYLLFAGWFEGGAFVSFLTLSLITSVIVYRWNDIQSIELFGQVVRLKELNSEAERIIKSLQETQIKMVSQSYSSLPSVKSYFSQDPEIAKWYPSSEAVEWCETVMSMDLGQRFSSSVFRVTTLEIGRLVSSFWREFGFDYPDGYGVRLSPDVIKEKVYPILKKPNMEGGVIAAASFIKVLFDIREKSFEMMPESEKRYETEDNPIMLTPIK